jgi:hypothetical protein
MLQSSNIGPELMDAFLEELGTFFAASRRPCRPLLDRAKRRSLLDILVLAVCATLDSADGRAAILTGFSGK